VEAGEVNYDFLGPIVAAYMPAREADSVEGWGFVRCDGSMLLSNKFASAPSAAVNGYFTVREGQSYTVYKAAKEPYPVDGLNGLVYAGAMSYGLMPVTWRGKRVSLVDGDGVVRMELTSISGREIVKTAPYFIDGLLTVYTQDGLWGAINTDGEMVLEPVYDMEPRFSENIAPVSRTVEEPGDSSEICRVVRYYLVNSNGRTIFTFPQGMKPRSRVHGGALVVELPSGRLAKMGIDGSVSQLPPSARRVGDFDCDYLVWSSADERYGMMDKTGRQLIEPQYKSIHIADSNRVLMESVNHDYCIADSAGNPRVRLSGFDKVTYLRRPAAGVVSPFQYLGDGYAGKVMLDGRGHRIGLGPFVEMKTALTLLEDGYVHTDFFNTQASVHALLSALTNRGWGEASLHERMSLLTDTLGDKMTRSRSLQFHRDTLYMLMLEAVAYSNRPVAIDSVTEDGAHIFKADTLSKVKYIRVEAAVPGRKFAPMVQRVGQELVPAGYRAEKIRDEYAVYAGENLILIFTPRPSLEGMYLYVMDRDFYQEAGKRIIADAEKLFHESSRQPRQ